MSTCTSTSTSGHVYVDTPDNGGQCSGTYRDAAGHLRQWQHCTGCGNVKNRRAATFANVKPGFFRGMFDGARYARPIIAESTSAYETSRGTKFYLWSDGRDSAGYGIRPTGELVYVFSTARGMGDAIVVDAITRGASHLDCFDGHLVDLYSRHGFGRVTSLPNWTPGGPDVVYMARPGYYLAALESAGRDLAAAPVQ